MKKNVLLFFTVLCILVMTAGCSLFEEDETILVIKNHADSLATIDYVTITQYIGGGVTRKSYAPNALSDGQTIAAGAENRLFFELAPVQADDSYLSVRVRFNVGEDEDTSNDMYNTTYLVYEPDTKFKLVYNCDGTEVTRTLRKENEDDITSIVELD